MIMTSFKTYGCLNKDLTFFSCFCAYEKKDVIVYAIDIFFCCLI